MKSSLSLSPYLYRVPKLAFVSLLAIATVSAILTLAVSAAKSGNAFNVPANGTALSQAQAGLEPAPVNEQVHPLSLATDDLNRDGFPDLVVGYARDSGGSIVIHYSNPEAFGPSRPETLDGIARGHYPEPFLPDTETHKLLEAPDFLAIGDFDRSGSVEILFGARNSSSMFLVRTDSVGSLQAPELISLPGQVTAFSTGIVNQVDTRPGVVLGLSGAGGTELLVFNGTQGILSEPLQQPLPAVATEIVLGRFDEDTSPDLAVVTGGQLFTLHGIDARASLSLEMPTRSGALIPIQLPFAVRAVAAGDFIWDRAGQMELAVASDAGNVSILSRGTLNTKPLNDEEISGLRQRLAEAQDGQGSLVDATGQEMADQLDWQVAETTAINISNIDEARQAVLVNALLSGHNSSDLLVVNPGERQLQIAAKKDSELSATNEGVGSTAQETKSIEVEGSPVAVLSMRLGVLARPGLVILRQGSTEPIMIPSAPTAIFTVSKTTDTNDGTCNADCSLREAVVAANATPGSTILFAAALNGLPIQLTRTGDDNTAANGDLDINADVTITGNGAANTIIQGSSTATFTGNMGDKAFGINQDGTHTTLNVSISGLTVRFTRNDIAVNAAFTQTGGGMDIFLTGTGAMPGPTTTLTNCTIDSNASLHSYGGGINIDSGTVAMPVTTNVFRGTVQITGSTISNNKTLSTSLADNPPAGGGLNLFADQHNVTFTTCSITGNQTSLDIRSNGGGLNMRHSNGGTITLTTTAVNNNTAGSDGGGILIAGVGGQTVVMTGGSLTGNTATGTGDSGAAGGIFNANNVGSTSLSGVTISNNIATAGTNGMGGGVVDGANTPLSINNCTISGNSSDNGGGVATTNVGGTQTTTITNGTTISGNTATNSGGGVFVTSGTASLNGITIDSNTAASGDGIAVVATGIANCAGTINVNGGDSISLTGGSFTSTSGTLNLTGNFTRDLANTFTHNNGTVNFNGAGAQLINGTATSTTFNSFIVNKGNTLSTGGSVTSLVTNGLTMTAGTFSAPALLDINGNATLNGGNLSAGANITEALNWTNNGGTFTPNTGTVTFDGAVAQSINGTAASQTFNNFTVNKGGGSTLSTGGSTVSLIMNNLTMTLGNFTAPATLDINGNTLLTAGTLTAGANITAAGNWANNGGTFTPGSGTVTFDTGTASSLNGTAATQTFNNFVVNKSGGSLTGASSTTTLTLNGSMTLTAGTFAAGTITNIGLPGNWTNNGGTFTPGSSIVTFNSNAAPQSINGTAVTQTFFTVSVNKPGQTLSTGGSTTALDLDGSLVLTAGSFTAPATMNIGASFTQDTGFTFTPPTTMTFDSGTAGNINGTLATKTFNNIVINKTNSLTGSGGTTAIDINGSLTLTAGTLVAGTATTITVANNWANTGTFTGGTGTVIFDGNNNTQTVTGSTSFNNLTINHTGTGNVTAAGSTLTVSGLLRVQGGSFISSSTFNNVQIDSGQTLQGTLGTTMNVSGNWTNNGGTFTANGNTVNFNGGAAQSINGTANTQTFDNLTVNKTVGIAVTVGGSTTTLDINGNVILTQGIFSAGTATAITVAGNWTNNGGVFTPGTGTVTFDGGAGQTIGGTTATSFGNLTNANATGLAMANDNTLSGLLALGGSDITLAAARVLTQPSTIASTGTSDVIGAVKRTGGPFASATTLTFGNPNNQITFGAAGTKPTDLTVTLAKTAPPNPNGYASAVQRTYTIAKTGGAGFTATLRLHYLDAELNGNSEPLLNLRFERASDSHWAAALPSVVDQVSNHVECNAVSDTMLPVRWTFSSLAPTASNGVITGRIVDDKGAPVEGAVVRLQGTQNRKFITDANGYYRFDNVETNGFYTVTPARANYSFSPAERSFSLVGQSTEATFGATIVDDGFENPLDTPEYFVRQHYLDFLNREPDEAGFNFWSDQIIGCGTDQGCIERKRVNVSAAYFLSIEFQRTGGLVDGLYRAAYGVRPDFAHFLPDTRTVGNGVRVGSDGWEALLASNTETFVNSFVNRAEFHAAYDSLSNADYVDTLISHTGVSFTSAERDTLVNGLAAGSMTRAQALRSIAEDGRFVSAKFNETFVMMEYFGYLRRDADANGFAFWLNKLNQFNGNFEQAEMVKAFIVSGEYRDRFPR